jgi:hypothetical protein
MTYVLIIPGALVLAGCIALFRWWRRSRQHIGVVHPSAPAGSVSYKQVVSPGSQSPDIDAVPLRGVEDALAQRPGAPLPGQTFSPGNGGSSGEPDQNPQSPEDPPSQS